MGRTKGSKNKPKIAKNPIEIAPTNSSNTINRFAKTDFGNPKNLCQGYERFECW